MNLIAQHKNFFSLFDSWISLRTDAERFLLFRRLFIAVWIVYDATDLALQGSIRAAWMVRDDWMIISYVALQIGLITAEFGIFQNHYPRFLALVCLIFRGIIAFVWPLNDFLFYCVIMAILTQCKVDSLPTKEPHTISASNNTIHRWPIDVIIAQTAWVYFATAFLKISPLWISGGGLYVRIQDAKRLLAITYPAFLEKIFSDLTWLSALAKIAVVGELTISYLIIHCLMHRNRPNNIHKYILCFLTICVHTFAALTTNVFFFGAVMITTVVTLHFPNLSSKKRESD